MKITNTEAFVIRSIKYGDSSKIITLYSSAYGKISILAKGVRNYKSRSIGVLDTMNHVNVFFYKNDKRDLQLLSKSDCINSFSSIKSNLDKLKVAYRICEIVDKASYDFDKGDKIFTLMRDVMNEIETLDKNFDNFLIYFQMKITELLGIGYPLRLKENLLGKNNVIVSETLLKENIYNKSVNDTLNMINDADIKSVGIYDINPDVLKKLEKIFDYYLADNLSISNYWKTGTFL